MGPSLVLSTIGSMAADWNRNSLDSTFNNNGSSNDDDEEEDGGNPRRHSFPAQERVTESEGIRSVPSFAAASFRSHSEVDSVLRREHASTYSYNTRASRQYVNRASVDNTASTQREPSFNGLDFSMSPLYSSVNVGQYLPLDGAAENNSNRLESKLEDDEDDDRKPAAVDSPQNAAAQERTYGYLETGQTELASPHRKSHSISSDPFHSASTSNIEQQVSSTSHERLIDPSFSFEEEYDTRGFDGGQGIIQNVWDVPESGNDPKFNVHRRRHFTPPHATFAAPHRSAYNDPAPQTIEFRLGDGDPNIDEHPTTSTKRNVVVSIASHRESRKLLSPRPSLQIATHQSIRAPGRNVSFRRREASAIELGSAETDRARSAILVWYRRFNELIDYCEEHGDCNVPQKHAPNPQLGIVRITFEIKSSLDLLTLFPVRDVLSNVSG